MKNRSSRIGLALACLMALVVPRLASASISHGMGQSFDPDGLLINAWMNGTNAVARQVYTNVDIYRNDVSGRFYITTSVQIDGDWGNPNEPTTSDQMLIDHGIHVMADYGYNRFAMNGDEFEFSVPIHLNVKADYRLERYMDPDTGAWQMYGVGLAYFRGNSGIYPVSSHDNVTFHTLSGFPGGDRHTWSSFATVTYIVTSDVNPTPAPGAAALLGLGGLLVTRRHRRQ